MKQKEAKQEKKKRYLKLAGITAFCMLLLVALLLTDRSFLFFSRAEEETGSDATTTQVKDLKSSYEKLTSDKENAKQLLKVFEKEKGNVVVYMNKLDKKLGLLEEDISNMKKQRAGIEDYLHKVQQQLTDDKTKEQEQYDAMKRRIRYLYQHGNSNYLTVLTGSTSFGDMLNRASNISRIQSYDNRILKQYRASLKSIARKEALISEKNEQLAQLTVDLNTEKESVTALIDDKSKELKGYNHNIKAAGSLIAAYEKSLREQENKMKQAETAAQDPGDETYASLPEEYTGGKFLWPVPGNYTITSPFGYRVHPLTGTRRLHGGIDISCPSGSSVYASADGVVAIAVYSSSAGNYIMINHGGGLSTVYMHNSKLLVSAGDKVSRGQRIALSGSTGWSTGPHCHYGVRKNGTYVNPIPYLKSTKNSDNADYTDEEVPDSSPEENADDQSEDPKSHKMPSTQQDASDSTRSYTTQADDSGDKKHKSSDLKDDSDPDSE